MSCLVVMCVFTIWVHVWQVCSTIGPLTTVAFCGNTLPDISKMSIQVVYLRKASSLTVSQCTELAWIILENKYSKVNNDQQLLIVLKTLEFPVV